MRLTSLLLLAAVVGGVGYVLLFQRDWLFKMFGEGVDLAKGYTAADTPAKAMDFYLKAIKSRNYKTAAKYVTGNYAEYLVKAHESASAIGEDIDWLTTYSTNKGVATAKTVYLLHQFDPYPTNLEIEGEPKKVGDDKATGLCKVIPLVDQVAPLDTSDAKALDAGMMVNCLNVPILFKGVPMVREGTGDKGSWKLQIQIPDPQINAINYFIKNHVRYRTGLDDFRSEVNRQSRSYASKSDFERDLLEIFRKAAK